MILCVYFNYITDFGWFGNNARTSQTSHIPKSELCHCIRQIYIDVFGITNHKQVIHMIINFIKIAPIIFIITSIYKICVIQIITLAFPTKCIEYRLQTFSVTKEEYNKKVLYAITAIHSFCFKIFVWDIPITQVYSLYDYIYIYILLH